jgi:hypothetical protein
LPLSSTRPPAAHAAWGPISMSIVYTHSRVREAFLGGVTHNVLKNAQIPVVMMH